MGIRMVGLLDAVVAELEEIPGVSVREDLPWSSADLNKVRIFVLSCKWVHNVKVGELMGHLDDVTVVKLTCFSPRGHVINEDSLFDLAVPGSVEDLVRKFREHIEYERNGS